MDVRALPMMGGDTCHGVCVCVYVEARWQLYRVGFLPILHVFPGSDSGHQACKHLYLLSHLTSLLKLLLLFSSSR